VESALGQTAAPAEVAVVVDHDHDLFRDLRAALPDVRVVENGRRRGLSGARNEALLACRSPVVAFLDDDAVAAPDWLARLLGHVADPCVMAAGGWAEPDWEAGRPEWFPPEFDWVVGASYRGLPEVAADVRNVLGSNMMLVADLVRGVGGFREDMGRLGERPLGCEETELCIRLRQRWPERRIVHDPLARVRHHVPRQRAALRYYVRRCYAEGVSKAAVAASVGGRDATAAERRHVLRTLPAGALRDVLGFVRGRDPGGVLRAGAIGLGAAVTAAGFLAGWGFGRRWQRTTTADRPGA
jgi:glycosyltransferase involved in cell wall biosynthesis